MSNYDASDFRTAATVSGEVEKERQSGIIDWTYIKGLPALLKGLEALFSLIAYICVEASNIYCVRNKGDTDAIYGATFGYFKFVTLTAFATVMVLYGLRLFKLHTRVFRCACVNWPLVELSYNGLIIVFYLFANLFMSLHSCAAAHKAGTAFGWFASFVFAVDLFFAIKTFHQSRKESRFETSSPTTEAGRY